MYYEMRAVEKYRLVRKILENIGGASKLSHYERNETKYKMEYCCVLQSGIAL